MEERDLAVEQKLASAALAIADLPLSVEVVGAWLWVDGDTKPVKEQLKAAGFKWAPRKQRWYFPGKPAGHRRGKREMEMDEIRQRHGSAWLKQDAEAA